MCGNRVRSASIGLGGAARVGEGDRHEVVLEFGVPRGAEQVGEPAAQHAEPAVPRRGYALGPGDAKSDPVQPASCPLVVRLGKGIGQRRAAVAQVRGEGLLGRAGGRARRS